MPRPTDWNAIGLSGDPTPGDPDRLDELLRSMKDLGRVAREIDDAFVAVLNKTDGAFVGQTADALREKISVEVRDLVRSLADAFETSARALNAYITVMRDQQWRADNALEQGRGLPEDDPRREELATTARLAGEAQAEAGKTAGEAMRAAARGVKRPVSGCEEFWNVFKWIAVAMILPALLVGGPVALLAFGINLTIFVKTMVDAAGGKADLLEVFLAALGIIAPTTRAFPLGQMIGKTLGKGLSRGSSHIVHTLTADAVRRALSSFRFAPGMGRFVLASAAGLKTGPLWILTPLRDVPRVLGTAAGNGASAVFHGIRALPGVIVGVPGQVFRTNSPMWRFAGRHLGGVKGLRLVLPVDAMEIGAYGLKGALRIGFVERGLKFRHLTGAPPAGALGRGAAALSTPPSYRDPVRGLPPAHRDTPPGHGTDFVINMVRVDPVDLTAARRSLDPFSPPPGGSGVFEPPPFTRAGGFATTWRPLGMFELDASLNVAARGLDVPIRELTAIRNGDMGTLTFTPRGVRGDLGPAAASGAARGTRGELGLTPVYDVAPGVRAFDVPEVVPAPHAAAAGAPGTPRTTGNAPALQPGPLPGAPAPYGGNALDLLATPSAGRAGAPALGAVARLDDPAAHALTANQVTLHLTEFAPRPAAHVAARQTPALAAPAPIPAVAASAAPPPPSIATVAGGAPPPSPLAATIPQAGPADRVTSALALLDDGGRARTMNAPEPVMARGDAVPPAAQASEGTWPHRPEGAQDRPTGVSIGQDGSRVPRSVDDAGGHRPHPAVAAEPVGAHQVADASVPAPVIRHGTDGEPRLTRSPGPYGTFVVTEFEGHGVGTRLENAAGEVIQGSSVQILTDGSVKISFDHGPRAGEHIVQAADGRPLRQVVNEFRDGRPTGGRYVVDYAADGGPAWRFTRSPYDPQHGPSGVFHRGTADVSADGGRIRLFTGFGGKVEVFERRVLPGGNVLDAFRPTGVRLGAASRQTTWVEWSASGTLSGHGVRLHDTSGLIWRDYDSHRGFVREFRQGLHETGGRPGHVIAINGRGEDVGWTWHRFDGLGRELGSGPRTMHRDGGWTDRLGDGTVAQKQWGKFHLPGSAGHYLEYDWDLAAGAPAATWQLQSSQGKAIGAAKALGDGMISVVRWSDQRPPLWVRKAVIGVSDPEPALRHLRTDNRMQIHSWVKEGGASPGSGFRYVSMDGGFVDLDASGRFIRATAKAYDGGGVLKVGDHAAPPGYPAPGERAVPWQDSARSGYRVAMDPAPPAARADLPVWQDRFQTSDGRWLVAREGFPDGSIRRHRTPYPLPENGGPGGRPDGPWTQRDAHGLIVARQDDWPDAAAPGGPASSRISVEGRGSPNSASWRWTARDDHGQVIGEGLRVSNRGARDPSLPWDDSFRDFDAAGALIREADMLDGGGFVQAWKGTDPASGRERWFVRKYDAAGDVVSYGDGLQVRLWWDPKTRAWSDRWFDGARHFRDEFHPANGGGPRVVREVPPHLSDSDGPLRVREYLPGGGADPVPGAWKEFDHGIVVRERVALGDGTFLEKDAWRGQWRRYDGAGRLIAQRTDSGWVFETGPDGRMRLTGSEYDFRGVGSELRGWGRRIRETERLPWGDPVSVDSARFQAALDGVPGLPSPVGGRVNLGEAAYQPYSKLVGQRMLLEFGQEFLMEFGTNLGINAIVASAQNRPFNGQDVLRSFANAAISGGVKSAAGSMTQDIRASAAHRFRTGLGNIDSGKPATTRPYNSDKHWRNEWAGNESPVRWRGGAYDFAFTTMLNPITNFVTGSMNAAVWGIVPGHTDVQVLSGTDAMAAGGITALARLTSGVSAGAIRHTVIAGGDGRLWHRYGIAEYLLQAPFKFVEKYISTVFLAPAMRAGFAPSWYTSPTGLRQVQADPDPQADPRPAPEPDPGPDPDKQG